ncbi:MAG: NADH:ubiquinone oxidoreductase subunit NDUFA12 [Alphaproteobacteria bacterium]|nr:NADH:ubiquinone oxidoreductase subunit NDUFA12 [Alphaproteobacteria bacterium]
MTIGTRLFTWRNGELVGTDAFGNRYFRGPVRQPSGREQRWVLYKGKGEASKVPAEWHAWLHHTAAKPLETGTSPWQKPHIPNLTGTPLTYLPQGHDRNGGQRGPATGDYQPWLPG